MALGPNLYYSLQSQFTNVRKKLECFCPVRQESDRARYFYLDSRRIGVEDELHEVRVLKNENLKRVGDVY